MRVPKGMHDEGHVALDRNLGDRGQRAVAARHPEHVRSGVCRASCLQIVALGEEMDGHAPCSRAASRNSSALGEALPEFGLTIRNRCIG